ncbi:MAG: WYL domain-containing protein [Desulfobulbaceae bacterium]|nr:WYL domain-containing protein [Desulfobulbaceae bacterium]
MSHLCQRKLILKERKWHPSQKIEENQDGSVILLLTVKHLLELKRWILSWGSMAEVLGPKSFVEENEKTIDEIRSLYRL